MKLVRLYRGFALAALLLAGTFAVGQKMTHEEEVVRTAYAKLAYAAQIGMLWHAVARSKDWPGLDDVPALSKAMSDQIRFELSGFKVGSLQDIGKASWTSLVEGPVDIVGASYHEVPLGIDTPDSKNIYKIVYADVWWKTPAASAIERQEDRSTRTSKNPTVAESIKTMGKPNGGGEWNRYASYSVVAILRGRSISYRATFIFANGKNLEVLPLDYALPQGAGLFLNSAMYPSALVDTAFREIPFVQAWILSNEISGCKKLTEPEVCCVPAFGRCGLAAEDLERSLKVLIRPEDRWIVTDRFKN